MPHENQACHKVDIWLNKKFDFYLLRKLKFFMDVSEGFHCTCFILRKIFLF